MSQTVSISFFRFSGVLPRLWAFAMMGLARRPVSQLPGIGFWKLCGSGIGEGFTPIPNTAVYALLATWPDETTARDRVANTPLFQRYRNWSDEVWTVHLSTTSSRGKWSGQEPFFTQLEPDSGPLAALTRATIKPSVLLRFWKRVPDISKVIGRDKNVVFKIGIGEVPYLHQITFSIWPDANVMAEFARKSGPHADAIRAVRDGNWFREELYARFAVLGDQGTWGGASPLQKLEDRT